MKIIVCSVKGNEPDELEKKLHEQLKEEITGKYKAILKEKETLFEALNVIRKREPMYVSAAVRPLITEKIDELERKRSRYRSICIQFYGIDPDE